MGRVGTGSVGLGTVDAGSHVDRSAARRPRDTLLLLLNVAIVIIGVAIVWAKLRERAGLGDREVPTLDVKTAPIPPRAGAPGRAAAGAPAVGTALDGQSSEIAAAPMPGVDSGPGVSEVGATGQQPATVPPVESSPRDAHPRLRGQTDAVPSAPGPRTQPVVAGLHAVAATEAVVDRIGVDVEVLHAIRGGYPSSAAPYGTNRGIEALHVALAKVGKTAMLRLGDTDDDGRLEILDAWGRPLIYFSPDDYRSTQRWVPGDDAAVDIGACRSAASQGFHADASYQLWSVGPDGRPGGGGHDDVTSWVRPD